MKSDRYSSTIVGLCAMLAILLIAFGTLVAVSQPTATKVALAESSDEITSPVVDTPSDSSDSSNPDDASDVNDINDSQAADTADTSTSVSPAEKIYASARYLATYLALGCYEGLPGADELYNQLLGEIGISIMDNETLVDEIEAVTAALDSSPDLWHRYADEALNRSLLPA